jgi:hypothetical protein
LHLFSCACHSPAPLLPWPLPLLLEWLPPSAKELPKPPRLV